MNNIDILEELKKNLDEIIKEPLGKDEMSNGNLYEYERGYELDLQEIQAILTLISENKELKEKVKEINEEYSAEQKYEMENTIPKSKIAKLIEKLKKEKESKRVLPFDIIDEQNKNINYKIEILQSLLGKE